MLDEHSEQRLTGGLTRCAWKMFPARGEPAPWTEARCYALVPEAVAPPLARGEEDDLGEARIARAHASRKRDHLATLHLRAFDAAKEEPDVEAGLRLREVFVKGLNALHHDLARRRVAPEDGHGVTDHEAPA